MPIREGFEEKKKRAQDQSKPLTFFYGKGLQESFAFIILPKKKKSIFLLSIYIYIYIYFRTVYLQGFQPETNHYSHWVSPRRGKALAQEILFKVQVAGLKLESIPNRAQYKHLETESPTNSTNP